MTTMKLEVIDDQGDKMILSVVLPRELWDQIESLSKSQSKSPEEVLEHVLGVGLSMTHGVG